MSGIVRSRSVVILTGGVWIAALLAFAAVLWRSSDGRLPFRFAVIGSLMTSLVPTAGTVALWGISRRWVRPDRSRTQLAFGQFLSCTVFVSAWTSWEAAQMAMGGGHRGLAGTTFRTAVLWQGVIGFLVYGVLAGSIATIRFSAAAKELAVARERAERLRVEAELSSLRAHLNPHFLFNTLHAVTGLIRSDVVLAERALEELSDVFRYVLRLDRERVALVTLEEEWHFTKRYLWLEKLRMGDRLRIVEDIDDDVLTVALPPFTLQPLVENAIRHGLGPKRVGGTVTVRAWEGAEGVGIEVSDDGVGQSNGSAGGGLGIRAVAQRLTARFGDTARISTQSSKGDGYRVHLVFPAVDCAQVPLSFLRVSA
jgi:hypothetical protein